MVNQEMVIMLLPSVWCTKIDPIMIIVDNTIVTTTQIYEHPWKPL